jgi:ribonuclease HI
MAAFKPTIVLKWNADGSSLGKPGMAGVGGVLRDCNVKVICLFSIPIRIKDSNEAELIDVVKALELTSSREDMFGRSIMVESDSANMVHRALTPSNRLWCYQELFILASRFSYALRTVNFTHTKREANHMQTNLRNKQFQESVSLWLECDVVTMF